MATQTIDKPLAVAFTCPTTIEVGDVAVISSDLSIIKSNGIAQDEVVGTVIKHEDDMTSCVVSTPFRKRTTRTASTTSPLGPFVWNTLNRVTPFVNAPFASVTGTVAAPWVVIKNVLTGSVAETFAIAKATITGSVDETYTIAKATITGSVAQTFAIAKATITGTIAETFAVVLNASDKVSISVNGAAVQDFTLTAGPAKTAAEVAADFALGTGFTATVDATNHVVFTATTAGQSLEIKTIANHAYTILGFTVSATPVYGNDQFAVSVNGAADQVFSLTVGAARTAANIVTNLAGAAGFAASAGVGNYVVLTATTAGQSLEISSVNGNAYTALGFTVSATPVYGNDQFSVSVNGAADQVFSLTAGAARTAANIVTDLVAATGFAASAVNDHVVLTATTAGQSLEISAVNGDAYAALGFIVSVAPVYGNDILKVAINGGGAQTFSLTAGAARTAANIATDLSGASGFVASAATGHVVLTPSNAGHAIQIVAVSGNAYTTLGFTVATVTPNCMFKLKVGTGNSQTVTFATAGSRTAAQIVTEFSAVTDVTVSATAANKIKFTVDDVGTDFEIEAITGSSYALLGFTAGITDVAPDSHDAGAVGGVVISGPEPLSLTSALPGPYLITNGSTDAFKITVGANASETFDLTAGTARTAAQVATDINATAVAFTAEATYLGQLKITAIAAWEDIEIETVANDAYDILGFTVDTYAASTTVTTLEY